MSPLALQLLRRIAGYALVFALLLWAAPKLVRILGAAHSSTAKTSA